MKELQAPWESGKRVAMQPQQVIGPKEDEARKRQMLADVITNGGAQPDLMQMYNWSKMGK